MLSTGINMGSFICTMEIYEMLMTSNLIVGIKTLQLPCYLSDNTLCYNNSVTSKLVGNVQSRLYLYT